MYEGFMVSPFPKWIYLALPSFCSILFYFSGPSMRASTSYCWSTQLPTLMVTVCILESSANIFLSPSIMMLVMLFMQIRKGSWPKTVSGGITLLIWLNLVFLLRYHDVFPFTNIDNVLKKMQLKHPFICTNCLLMRYNYVYNAV